jgi:CheY-like chemotaxis protein
MAHVLIVDDDDAIREALRYALEDAGHMVSEATDGLAALRFLRRSTDHIVALVDLMMPGLDGAGLLGAVAGDAQLSARNAYILMTANPKTLPLAFANLLVDLDVPFLPKPFDVDDLLRVVGVSAERIEHGPNAR